MPVEWGQSSHRQQEQNLENATYVLLEACSLSDRGLLGSFTIPRGCRFLIEYFLVATLGDPWDLSRPVGSCNEKLGAVLLALLNLFGLSGTTVGGGVRFEAGRYCSARTCASTRISSRTIAHALIEHEQHSPNEGCQGVAADPPRLPRDRLKSRFLEGFLSRILKGHACRHRFASFSAFTSL